MAEYEKFENEGGGGFMLGLLTGAVIGAGIGMLLAPKAGSEIRGQVAEQAKNFGNKAGEQYRRASETATEWADKGRDLVNQAREGFTRGAEEAREFAGTTAGTFGDRPATGGTDYGRS